MYVHQMDEDGLVVAQKGQRRRRAQKPALMFHAFGDDTEFDERLDALWATDRRRAATTLSAEAQRRFETADQSVYMQVEQMSYPISNLCCAFLNKNFKVLSTIWFFLAVCHFSY